MASFTDMLSALSSPGDWLSEHPGTEEVLGALPAIAGAYMLSRPFQSRIGTPLGAALGTAGGLLAARGYKDSQNQAQLKQDAATRAAQVAALKQVAPGTGPVAPLNTALPTLVGGGFDPGTALSIAKAEEGKPKDDKSQYDYWFNPDTGEERVQPKGTAQPGNGFYTSSFKPPKVGSTNIYEQAAGELGLPSDSSKWSQQDRLAIRTQINKDKQGGQKPEQTTELKQIYDPKTGNTKWTYVPKAGAVGSSPGEVRPPMGANAVADADATATGLDDLKSNLQALKLSPSQQKLPNWAAVLRQKAGFAAGDPKVTDALAQVSIINTTLTGLVMRSWGSRNPAAAQQIIDLHVPKATDSQALLFQKIDWWKRVGLKQYKQMLGATDTNLPAGGGDEEEEPPEGAVPLD